MTQFTIPEKLKNNIALQNQNVKKSNWPQIPEILYLTGIPRSLFFQTDRTLLALSDFEVTMSELGKIVKYCDNHF